MKTKLIGSLAYFFVVLPSVSWAQFVEEQSESNPSDLAVRGNEALDRILGFVNVLIAILFVTSIIGFFFTAIKFIVAGGSESVLSDARRLGIASLTGFLLSLVGYIVVNVIKHLT